MTKLQVAGAAMTVLMAASLSACNKAAPAVDTAKDVAAITDLENQAVAASVAHQSDKFAAMYPADGVFIAPGAPVARGPDAIAKAVSGFSADTAYNFKLTMDRVEVSKDGSLAYALWRYDQTSTDAKTHKVVHEIGSGIDALRKGADGGWKFVASINTPSPDAAAAAKP